MSGCYPPPSGQPPTWSPALPVLRGRPGPKHPGGASLPSAAATHSTAGPGPQNTCRFPARVWKYLEIAKTFEFISVSRRSVILEHTVNNGEKIISKILAEKSASAFSGFKN